MSLNAGVQALAARVAVDIKALYTAIASAEGFDPSDIPGYNPAETKSLIFAALEAPSVGTTNSETGTSLGSSNAQPLPASSSAGDLILMFVVNDNTSSTNISGSTGWELLGATTQGSNVIKTAIFARVLTGTGGDNILAVSGASQDYCVGSVRIPSGTHAVVNPATDIFFASASGSSGNANPPSLDTGVAKPYLWISVAALDSDSSNITADPSGYSTALWNLSSASSSSSCRLRGAAKQATSQTDDPGTFTNSSRPWITYTVAIPPGSGGLQWSDSASTATEDAPGVVELATLAEALEGTDTARAVTSAGVAAVAATKSDTTHGHALTDANMTGILPIAQVPTGTSGSTVALGNHGHALTDANMTGTLPAAQLPAATESAIGAAEIATSAEVITGTDNTRIVSPAGLAARTATDARTGVVELATNAETTTGTDTSRATTPAGVKAVRDAMFLNGLVSVWKGTQTQYDAIGSKDSNTLYVIIP